MHTTSLSGRKIWPYLVLLAWISLIGTSTWQSAKSSRQPPLYDALGYYAKAKSFYEAWSDGSLGNPLNTEPPSRPPGTIAVSYPFGFNEKPNGFFFRSVYIPFVIWCIAVWIAVTSSPKSKRDPGIVVAYILLFGSVPFFFQYDSTNDISTTMYWGMVDGFLAAVSALAVACALRGLTRESAYWSVAAAALASFTPLIKPSGFYVLALTAAFYWCGAVLAFFRAWRSGRALPERWKALTVGAVSFGLCGSAIYVACTRSSYLTETMFAYGAQSLKVLKSDFTPSLSLEIIWDYLAATLGFAGPAILICLLLAGIRSVAKDKTGLRTGKWTPLDIVILGSMIVIFSFGTYFWLVMTGVTQIRYFYPFLLMALALSSFLLSKQLYANSSRMAVFTLYFAASVSAGNLALILSCGSRFREWQAISGVNISINELAPLAEFGKAVLRDALNSDDREDVQIYIVAPGLKSGVLYSVGYQNTILYPDAPKIITVLPVDWQRPSVIRLHEILDSDYIVTNKYENPVPHEDLPTRTFAGEMTAFDTLLFGLSEESGVRVAFDGAGCRVLQVINQGKLAETLRKFVEANEWRSLFEEENQSYLPGTAHPSESTPQRTANLSITSIKEAEALTPPSFDDYRGATFGGAFTLRGLNVERKPEGLYIRLAWEKKTSQKQVLTNGIHLVDDKGSILGQADYSQPYRSRNAQSGDMWLDVKFIPSNEINSNVTHIAIALYSDPNLPLRVEGGIRDWDGHRLIIKID